jgi:hypothetical protein
VGAAGREQKDITGRPCEVLAVMGHHTIAAQDGVKLGDHAAARATALATVHTHGPGGPEITREVDATLEPVRCSKSLRTSVTDHPEVLQRVSKKCVIVLRRIQKWTLDLFISDQDQVFE